jgi:uncharacterized membrane protein YcaP (DUF421 family)
LALLIGLQYLVSWSSVRLTWVRRFVRSEPALLVRRGVMIDEAMRRERITEGEVFAAIRAAGVRDLDSVDAVVLETDGSLSVLPQGGNDGAPSALRGVSGVERHADDARRRNDGAADR